MFSHVFRAYLFMISASIIVVSEGLGGGLGALQIDLGAVAAALAPSAVPARGPPNFYHRKVGLLVPNCESNMECQE